MNSDTKRVRRHPPVPAGVVAASTPPNREIEASDHRRIPPDILDEILSKLPVKSLVRFRCVSKSWKSRISESGFIRMHINGATVVNKRVIINHNPIQTSLSCPLSSISSLQRIDNTTNLICPFRADVELKAFCEELWCVEVGTSLHLWNPSIGASRKLPDRLHLPSYVESPPYASQSVYGMAYDAPSDDYKLLKLWRIPYYFRGTFLYSLRDDSWREIDHKFPGNSIPRGNGVFVNGAFHWMVFENHDDWLAYGRDEPDRLSWTILSFNLSTERYEEVPQPVYSPTPSSKDDVEVAVLRGMLCVFLNYRDPHQFVLWEMKDYGVEESWTRMYDIRYDCIPSVPERLAEGKLITLGPLYLYENGEFLIWLRDDSRDSEMVIYKDGEIVALQEIGYRGSEIDGGHNNMRCAFVYVESLVSPAAWPRIGNNDQV